MKHQVTLFSDFNCPFCYALEERLVALNLSAQIRWQGVQHAPELPMPLQLANQSFAAAIEKEVLMVKNLMPEIDISFPLGKPNTLNAIQYSIAALRQNTMLGLVYRNTLAREFWVQGEDISDESVLRNVAQQLSLSLSIDSADRNLAEAWQKEWQELAVGAVPVLLRDDGKLALGLQPVETLQSFFDG